jgi:hypothetical protein
VTSLRGQQCRHFGAAPLDLDLDLVSPLPPHLVADLKLGTGGQCHFLVTQDQGASFYLSRQGAELVRNLGLGEDRLRLAALLAAIRLPALSD